VSDRSVVVDGAGARVERASKAIEEMAEKYRNAPRYRDRIAGWPIADLQKLVVGMSKPPWWRFILRWKWRKLVRNMCKPQPGLSGWKVIDCRNAPGHSSDVVFEPESFVLRDPWPARYASLDDALADMKEGTRKRAIRPLEKIGDRVAPRREYRDAPIGVGIVVGKESYQIAFKSPGDQEIKKEK
jgi:hypothetical protein